MMTASEVRAEALEDKLKVAELRMRQEGICMSCWYEQYGPCTDCLNTGYERGEPAAVQDLRQQLGPLPNWEGQFDTFDQWVSSAASKLTGRPDSNGWVDPKTKVGVPAVCIDAKGRRCTNGKDFMRARDENAFPVRYFWNCEPS